MKTKEEIKQYHKEYRKNNFEKMHQKQKEYKLKNLEKLKDYHKKYYIKNNEKINEHNKKYYIKNNEKIKQKHKIKYIKLQKFVNDIKMNEFCVICRRIFILKYMHFHHIDPNTKFMAISAMISSLYPEEKILAEIEKCEIQCMFCHRKTHCGEWDD